MKNNFLIFAFFAIVVLVSFCNNPQSNPAENSKEKKETQNLKSLSGTYEFETGNSIGSVDIRFTEDKEFEFAIEVGEQSGCTGEVAGKATLTNEKTAKFSNPECGELNFEFTDGRVEIKEKDCTSMHGMRCSFDGKYQKKQ